MTPDIVERLRDCAELSRPGKQRIFDDAADEITRLRERVSELEAAKRVAREGLRIADRDYQARIAHLERVQGAADDMRTWLDVNTIPAMFAREAYDAVRKGEG